MRAEALALIALVVASAGCARTEAAAGVPSPGEIDAALDRALGEVPARLTVVYWPATGECKPHEAAAIDVLRKLSETYADIRFLTVVPGEVGPTDPRYGLAYPGELVVVGPESAAAERGLGPRPRVAGWAGDGALVFVRSLPPVVSESLRLREEITWARALTEPVDEP